MITVQELRVALQGAPDEAEVGVFVEGDPQGHSVQQVEGLNLRENIFWLRVWKEDK